MSQHVLVEMADHVLRVELARADKKNALTSEMYGALAAALSRADADDAIRAVLLHGAPDCFSSGNDVADFLRRDPSVDPPALRFLRAISTARKPLVAAVAGPAIGIGTTLLLHCDLVYAAPSARFQVPFVPLGLVPEAASSLLLPMAAGHARAAELLLLGEPFGAEAALAAGIVTAVVPEGELLATARAAGRKLAALPPASVRLTKELMKRPHARAVASQMEEEGRVFAGRLASPEAREAMTAFLERRKPDFSPFS